MTTIAVVKEDGRVKSIYKPFGEVNTKTGDLDRHGNLLVVLADDNVDKHDFMKRMLWSGSEWIDIGLPPSPYYDWIDGVWVKQPRYYERVERMRKQKLRAPAPDAMSTVEEALWPFYKQALKDIDLDKWDDPDKVVWPQHPALT